MGGDQRLLTRSYHRQSSLTLRVTGEGLRSGARRPFPGQPLWASSHPTELARVGVDDTRESAPSEDSSWERTQQSVNTVSRTLCSPGRVHRRRPLTADRATGSSLLLLPGEEPR